MLININDYSLQGHVSRSNAYLTLKPAFPLSHWVQEFWQLNVPMGRYFYRSVPDNCVDIIYNITSPEEAFIVTPFSSAKVFEMTGPVSYFGMRFRVLGHQGIIKAPLGEWPNKDNVTDLNDVFPSHLTNVLNDCAYQNMPFQKRCNFLSELLLSVLRPSEVDKRLIQYMLYCDQHHDSNMDLSDKQCSEFGLSARHLRRLTSQYLGLTPRGFAKVFRFQKILKAMNTKGCANAWANHYYDQAHFNRDFKKLSGITPSEFQVMSALYNTD